MLMSDYNRPTFTLIVIKFNMNLTSFLSQKKQMSEKDKRFRVMNEILSGMKVHIH